MSERLRPTDYNTKIRPQDLPDPLSFFENYEPVGEANLPDWLDERYFTEIKGQRYIAARVARRLEVEPEHMRRNKRQAEKTTGNIRTNRNEMADGAPMPVPEENVPGFTAVPFSWDTINDALRQITSGQEDTTEEPLLLNLGQRRQEEAMGDVLVATAPRVDMQIGREYIVANPEGMTEHSQPLPIKEKKPRVDKNKRRLERGLPAKGVGRYSGR